MPRFGCVPGSNSRVRRLTATALAPVALAAALAAVDSPDAAVADEEGRHPAVVESAVFDLLTVPVPADTPIGHADLGWQIRRALRAEYGDDADRRFVRLVIDSMLIDAADGEPTPLPGSSSTTAGAVPAGVPADSKAAPPDALSALIDPGAEVADPGSALIDARDALLEADRRHGGRHTDLIRETLPILRLEVGHPGAGIRRPPGTNVDAGTERATLQGSPNLASAARGARAMIGSRGRPPRPAPAAIDGDQRTNWTINPPGTVTETSLAVRLADPRPQPIGTIVLTGAPTPDRAPAPTIAVELCTERGYRLCATEDDLGWRRIHTTARSNAGTELIDAGGQYANHVRLVVVDDDPGAPASFTGSELAVYAER